MATPQHQTRLCGRPAMDDLEALEAATSGPGVEQEPSPSPAGECWVPGASYASSASSSSAAQDSHGTLAKSSSCDTPPLPWHL